MSAVDDRVHAELGLLSNMQLAGMAPDAYQAWQNKIDDINDQYDKARLIENDKTSTVDQKKYAKDLGDSIAKGLPIIVKGLQSAIVAFEKGDAITGSAAIMDICAAAAPIISAMFNATGPEGMLVGALFSVIGQILAFFAPKQPSLKDQIQEMLQALNTETELQGLGAIRLSNEERDLKLTEIYHELAEHTNLSLLVRDVEMAEFDDYQKLGGKKIVVARGSSAGADAKARYPNCTIQFVDEVAKNQPNARGYIVKTLIANGQADALYGLDVSNQSLRDEYGGLAVADVHSAPGRRPSILELPLLDENDADAFEPRMKAINIEIIRAQAKSDHAAFRTWEVAAWLKMEEKQKYPRWPEVLGVWCQAYNELVSSNIKFNCLIDPQMVQQKVRYTHEEDGGCPLPKGRKATIHDLLTDLQGLALDLRAESAACYAVALEVLKAVTPAAQAWGLFAWLGSNYSINFTSGRAQFASSTDKSDSNFYHGLTIFPAPAQQEAGGLLKPRYDLKPRYHCLILKSGSREYPSNHSWLDHLWVHPDTFAVDDTRLIRDNPMFHDICTAQSDGRTDCWAVPGGRDGLEGWSLDKVNELQKLPGGWIPISKAPVENVRALYPMMDSLLEDDPDNDAIVPGSAWLDPRQATYAALKYAGLRSSSDIYVNGLNEEHYVPSPWSAYTGIAVDKHYLWVFAQHGFACATHASIMSCIQKTRATPRWMQHSLPAIMMGRFFTDLNGNAIDPDKNPMDGQRDFSGNRWKVDGAPIVRPMPPLQGLISMSPCEDGTIFASVVCREASRDLGESLLVWRATDRRRNYTTGYTIDVAHQAIQVDEPWIQLGGDGFQVQKMPIPCWSLFASLKARLELY